MNGSPSFSLSGTDLKKLGIGALLAMGGTLVTFLSTELLPNLDQSTLLGALLAGIASVVLNAFRKLVADTRTGTAS